MSQIPDEIKEKINKDSEDYSMGWGTGDDAESFRAGATFGYSLSLELLEQKDAEIKRLKGLLEKAYQCGRNER